MDQEGDDILKTQKEEHFFEKVENTILNIQM
jgi:hypothetical protein